MTLADPITFGWLESTAREGQISRPAQIANNAVKLMLSTDDADTADTGIEGTADASPVTDPAAEITRDTQRIMQVGGRGTTLRMCMKYNDGVSGVTSPQIQVFGRGNANDLFWRKLYNKSGDHVVTLTVVEATDVSNGTHNYTDADPDAHSWDLDGCNEILVGVNVPFNATGTETDAELLAWLL